MSNRDPDAAVEPRAEDQFQGRLVLRGDPDYEVARSGRFFNRRVPDRFPDAVLEAEVESDLVAAVRYAAARGWTIGIRSGGHSFPAWGLRDGGLLVDLGKYKELSYDPESQIVSASPSTMGGAELNPFLRPLGRFFPGGGCPTVAIGGFLLQGGVGWNFRGWGYASERIAAIDVVTADGELVRADAHHNSDLYWAAKGVGPGFCGLITRFHLHTLPIFDALTVTTQTFRIEDYAEVLEWLWEINATVSDQVYFNGSARVATKPLPGHAGGLAFTVTAIAFCDTTEEAREALAPFADNPFLDQALAVNELVPMTLDELVAITDVNHPEDRYYRVDSAWVSGPRRDIIAASHDVVVSRPDQGPGVTFFNFKLPSADSDSAMTLETEVLIGNYVISPDAEEDARRAEWLRESMAKLNPYTTGQYWGDSDQELRGVRCLTDEAWQRYQDIRRERDPHGLFAAHPGHAGAFDNTNAWQQT